MPDGYITSDERRIEFYTKMASICTLDEVKALLGELKDIYGDAPKPVVNLIATALVKNLGAAVGATKVLFKRTDAKVIFDKLKDISRELSEKARLFKDGAISLSPPSIGFSGAGAQKKLIKFLIYCREVG